LCHPSHDPPQVDPSRRGSFHSGAPQISLQKLDSEDDDDGNLQIPKLTFKLKFETTCPRESNVTFLCIYIYIYIYPLSRKDNLTLFFFFESLCAWS
jgi:hypothetical protein